MSDSAVLQPHMASIGIAVERNGCSTLFNYKTGKLYRRVIETEFRDVMNLKLYAAIQIEFAIKRQLITSLSTKYVCFERTISNSNEVHQRLKAAFLS